MVTDRLALHRKHISALTNKRIAFVSVDMFPIDDLLESHIARLNVDLIVFADDQAKYHQIDAHVFYRAGRTEQFLNTARETYHIDDGQNKIGSELVSRVYRDQLIIDRIESINISKPWIYVTSNYAFKHAKSVYFPIWLVNTCQDTIKNNIQMDITSPRDKLFCFMLFAPYWDRLIVLSKIYDQPWFKNCLYNYPDIDKDAVFDGKTVNLHHKFYDQALDFYLTEFEKGVVQRIAPNIADPMDTIDVQYGLGLLTNRSFQNSYINLFGESGYPHPNVTEKSVLPFLSGQIPAIWGADGLADHMTEMGFETMIDVVPRLTDASLTIRQKSDIIVNKFTEISEHILYVWNTTYLRRQHNYHYARSDKLIDKLTQPIRERLND